MKPSAPLALLALLPLAALPACTFCEGVAEVLQGEVAADVDNPKTFQSKTLTLQHPGNWSVDTEDSDYDPDIQFIIETTGECQVMIFLLPTALDERDTLKEYVEQFSKLMPSHKLAAFKHWGRYEGTGTIMTGALLVVPGQLRIFVHSDDTKDAAFTVVEQCYDEDMAEAAPGFKLIAESFDWHPVTDE